MIEHPGLPRERHKVSIWRTRLWSLIQKCGTTDVLVRQGYLGAASSKPTVLAFTGSHPNAHTLLHSAAIRTDLPQETSIGLSADGHFKTAKLKAYPPALCLGIARLFAAWLPSLPSLSQEHVPVEFQNLFEVFAKRVEADMGADFVPPSSRLIHFG